MQKIPGKQIADAELEALKTHIAEKGLKPCLAVLLVGNDPASELYVSLKEKAALRIGVSTDVQRMSANVTDGELIEVIRVWNADPNVHGILVQLPLPPGHDTDAVIAAIDPMKDVDGFHPENVKALEEHRAHVLSPLHESILRLIAATPVVPNHALAAILCNSETFAHPLKLILERAGATVRVVLAQHKEDKELRDADIIVVAVGKQKFLTSNGVRNGSVVIDVGVNTRKDGTVCGDFDAEACADMEGWYSPVPGGVGPMTVAMLMKNVVGFAEVQSR